MAGFVLKNATIATMAHGSSAYGLVENAVLAAENGRIVFVGTGAELPSALKALPAEDLEGRLVTPALIDCHTHIVAGGDRAREFEMRLEGASYEEIARAGGGIVSTVSATRQADADTLLASALKRVDHLIAEGVSTVEIKSGYGLDVETELRMLRTARAVATQRDIRVRTSFLGAHAVPPSTRTSRTHISTKCAFLLSKPPTQKVLPMQSTVSARASHSTRPRSNGCLKRPRRSACR